jgi:hypothetical protein
MGNPYGRVGQRVHAQALDFITWLACYSACQKKTATQTVR